MKTKKCDSCHIWLPTSEFSKNKSKNDGLQNKCKDCILDYKKKLRSGCIEKFEIVKRHFFYIPDIYLVGVGRTQIYQNSCLHCNDPFFCFSEFRTLEDLFCDSCQRYQEDKLNERNLSKINYIGNTIGWLCKCDSPKEKRQRKNYKKVYERDFYTCQYCGYNLDNAQKFLPLHIDHIKPWSAAGGNSDKNLVVSCSECNLLASDKWFSSFEDKKEYILIERKYRK